jgi:pyruvate dehydrogenase E2 component (dihydrolipoamide acetyltransferase)
MTTDVIMPKLGLTMKEGTVVDWLKKEGENVEKGEPIVEVETDKITNFVEANASGVLLRILALKGTTVPVTGLIAIIGEPGEEIPSKRELARETETPRSVSEKMETTEVAEKTPSTQTDQEGIRISPLARKLAEEYKIDPAKIKGTGPGGRIVKEDIIRAATTATSAPQTQTPQEIEVSETIPLTGTRKTIADRLSQSYHSAVHTTVITEVDMTEIVKYRQGLSETKEGTGTSITYTSIIAKSVAVALKKHPVVNSTLVDDAIKVFGEVNLGVAVDVEGGLIVPVIRHAEKKSLIEIASVLTELADKARKRLLSVGDISFGTFTITNLGALGVHTFIPIINPPQAAILGVGMVEQKPAVINGKVEVRSKMNLSLVFDHRIIDGAEAARFLQTLKNVMENPSVLTD